MLLSNTNLLNIFQKTLNLLDYRLVDHSERAAYLLMKMMEISGRARDAEWLRVGTLALLHDIGAYKTEQINSLASVSEFARFEFGRAAEHSAYGYVFVKHFLDFGGLEDILLYHHARYDRLPRDCRDAWSAAGLFVAGRYDLVHSINPTLSVADCFRGFQGGMFSPEAVDLLEQADKRFGVTRELDSSGYLDELYQAFSQALLSPVDTVNFLRMLVFMIDFRSPSTVTHTIYVVAFSMNIARLMRLPASDMQDLFLGGLLHDLGKIATPIGILEKPGRLTNEEFSVMKDHVSVTHSILEGCVSEKVLRIAARHHEKLDGSGYPLGLRERDLTLCERILAVADLASALLGKRSYKDSMPRDKVFQIVEAEARQGKICPAVVSVFLEHFDEIVQRSDQYSRPLMNQYQKVEEEFPRYAELIRPLIG